MPSSSLPAGAFARRATAWPPSPSVASTIRRDLAGERSWRSVRRSRSTSSFITGWCGAISVGGHIGRLSRLSAQSRARLPSQRAVTPAYVSESNVMERVRVLAEHRAERLDHLLVAVVLEDAKLASDADEGDVALEAGELPQVRWQE